MGRPIELTGIIHGKTITLDDVTFLPDGYRVKLELVLEPEESVRLAIGGWAGMTAEEIAGFEATMSDYLGRPFKMPE